MPLTAEIGLFSSDVQNVHEERYLVSSSTSLVCSVDSSRRLSRRDPRHQSWSLDVRFGGYAVSLASVVTHPEGEDQATRQAVIV